MHENKEREAIWDKAHSGGPDSPKAAAQMHRMLVTAGFFPKEHPIDVEGKWERFEKDNKVLFDGYQNASKYIPYLNEVERHKNEKHGVYNNWAMQQQLLDAFIRQATGGKATIAQYKSATAAGLTRVGPFSVVEMQRMAGHPDLLDQAAVDNVIEAMRQDQRSNINSWRSLVTRPDVEPYAIMAGKVDDEGYAVGVPIMDGTVTIQGKQFPVINGVISVMKKDGKVTQYQVSGNPNDPDIDEVK